MTDKEKIRVEAVRLITDLGEQRDVLLEELLEFIDSLPEDPHQELHNILSNLRDDAFSKATKESWEACLSEEPVSEELDIIAREYAGIPCDAPKDLTYCVHDKKAKYDAVLFGAQWQKEKFIANAADAMIGLPYENKDGGYTHLIDVSRPLPVGNNKIAIIFKED